MTRGGLRFEALYALAFVGAVFGFLPLIVLVLPRRVGAIAGDGAVEPLSWLLLVGGIAASVGHIVAGHISDRWLARHASRRAIIGLGLGALLLSYAVLAAARDLWFLAAAFVLFQLALNLMFAPLGALLADYVRDTRKGRVASWLNLALPAASGGIAAIGFLFPEDTVWAFAAIAAMIAVCVLPLLIIWPVGPLLESEEPVAAVATLDSDRRRDFALAWGSRLLIQFGGFTVTSYIYVYVEMSGERSASQGVAVLSTAAVIAAIAATLASGQISDRLGRRRLPLTVAALFCALALGGLTGFPSWMLLVIVYATFHLALASFIAIDSALVAQLVSGAANRGAMLGIMNLANTLPAILVPGFALALTGLLDTATMLTFLIGGMAIGAGVAAVMVARIRSVA